MEHGIEKNNFRFVWFTAHGQNFIKKIIMM